MNSSRFPMPPADFVQGKVSPLEFTAEAIQKTKSGFTIQMPSGTPVPTPLVYRGRLYVGGGFSSKEFYCFDAATGEFKWGADLSDDGPSTAVASGDAIIFNSESCTIFALDAGGPGCSQPGPAGGFSFVAHHRPDVWSVDPEDSHAYRGAPRH